MHITSRGKMNEMCIVVYSIRKLDHKRGDHIWFYAVGIGKEDSQPGKGWPLKKFSTLVSNYGDENVSASDTLVYIWCYRCLPHKH